MLVKGILILKAVVVVVSLLVNAVHGTPCSYEATQIVQCDTSTMDEFHTIRTSNFQSIVIEVNIQKSTIGSVESLMFDSGSPNWHQNIAKVVLKANDISSIDSYGFYYKQQEGGMLVPLPKVTYIDLTDNKITTIGVSIFRFLHVTNLYLGENAISEIENDAFGTLDALATLHLHHNQLTYLRSGVFKGLSQLQDLDLSYNGHIENIVLGAFQYTPNLLYLNIAGNNLSLPLGSFSALKQLHALNMNDNLINLTVLVPLVNLEELYMDGNVQAFASILRIPDYLPKLQNISMNNINEWHCENLIETVIEFRKKGLHLMFTEPLFEKQNVDGIVCY